jgi:catechol 2,3-dioxygenase-like lactoylglutathione lyase family enzyme
MRGGLGSKWWGTALDAPDPKKLADFYSRLLGWPISSEDRTWVTLKAPTERTYLAFHISAAYVPPVWPPADGQQQMMAHLDFEVDDLDAAVAHALECGATLAAFQPQDDVRVCLDPDGHPFCLYRGE